MRLIIAICVLLPSVIACTAKTTQDTGTNVSALTATQSDVPDGSMGAIKAQDLGQAENNTADTTDVSDVPDGSMGAITARLGNTDGNSHIADTDITDDVPDGSMGAIKARH